MHTNHHAYIFHQNPECKSCLLCLTTLAVALQVIYAIGGTAASLSPNTIGTVETYDSAFDLGGFDLATWRPGTSIVKPRSSFGAAGGCLSDQ